MDLATLERLSSGLGWAAAVLGLLAALAGIGSFHFASRAQDMREARNAVLLNAVRGRQLTDEQRRQLIESLARSSAAACRLTVLAPISDGEAVRSGEAIKTAFEQAGWPVFPLGVGNLGDMVYPTGLTFVQNEAMATACSDAVVSAFASVGLTVRLEAASSETAPGQPLFKIGEKGQ